MNHALRIAVEVYAEGWRPLDAHGAQWRNKRTGARGTRADVLARGAALLTVRCGMRAVA